MGRILNGHQFIVRIENNPRLQQNRYDDYLGTILTIYGSTCRNGIITDTPYDKTLLSCTSQRRHAYAHQASRSSVAQKPPELHTNHR